MTAGGEAGGGGRMVSVKWGKMIIVEGWVEAHGVEMLALGLHVEGPTIMASSLRPHVCLDRAE